jgi:hypothetical protein
MERTKQNLKVEKSLTWWFYGKLWRNKTWRKVSRQGPVLGNIVMVDASASWSD